MEFLFFEKEKTHIREISRMLKIPVSGVKREIDNLKASGLIEDIEGVSLNKKSTILEDLKNIFIKSDYITYPIKKAMDKTCAKFVLIFGSFAKGDYSTESDVDLLVVGNVKQSEIFEKIRPIERIIKRDINSVVWSLEDLKNKKKTGLIRDILKGRVIFIKGDENEFKKIIK